MNVVDLAWQIIEMRQTIEDQQRELEHLRWLKEHLYERLASHERHGDAMMGEVLKMCLTPGVVEAMGANMETKSS